MSEDSEEVLRLRTIRAELEDIKNRLEKARTKQRELDEEVDDLLARQREARAKRREAILAADAAKIPRLRISKESGMQRSNMYKLFDDTSGVES
ncbi:hypothetical protein [Allokutzneria sp. NRRL B-24872]|uniref:hypothetical protein n=1 Tax=Allokutzneria sp. NRRL B-24872 TaxID=1137961 RepID=UPI001178B4CB|nr:hypothetical protein [Allokutzneria sp. NRRL B-24872]